MLSPSSLSGFDAVAARYDELWTHSTIGRLQRQAVWRHIDPLFKPGDTLLDLGCGTGEDALHFMNAGVRVHAIDASSEMVRIARERGVDAEQLPIEELPAPLRSRFDAVISNFGALNCVARLDCEALARLVRPGGHLAICVIGKFCLWETAWHLFHGHPRKAFRRLQDRSASSLGRVYYRSVREIRRELLPDFTLIAWHGIGISVPPSYVTGLSENTLERFGRIDRRLGTLRSLSDHRLLIFKRK